MTITVSFCFSPSKLVKLSSCLSVIVACLDPGVVLVSGRERNTVSFPYSLQQKVKQNKKKTCFTSQMPEYFSGWHANALCVHYDFQWHHTNHES